MAIDYTRPEPEWWLPVAWPLWWRRAFLLTLPISGLLWLVAVAIAGYLLVICFMPLWWLDDLREKLWVRAAHAPTGND